MLVDLTNYTNGELFQELSEKADFCTHGTQGDGYVWTGATSTWSAHMYRDNKGKLHSPSLVTPALHYMHNSGKELTCWFQHGVLYRPGGRPAVQQDEGLDLDVFDGGYVPQVEIFTDEKGRISNRFGPACVFTGSGVCDFYVHGRWLYTTTLDELDDVISVNSKGQTVFRFFPEESNYLKEKSAVMLSGQSWKMITITEDNTQKEWRTENKMDRTDGPAFLLESVRGETLQAHWMRDGIRHRVDGPASYGSEIDAEYWYVGGVFLEGEGEGESE